MWHVLCLPPKSVSRWPLRSGSMFTCNCSLSFQNMDLSSSREDLQCYRGEERAASTTSLSSRDHYMQVGWTRIHTECSVPSHRPLARLSIRSCLLVLFHFSSASKVVVAGLLTVSGGIGGTVLYAKWDHKFRAAVEKNVPYSDWLLGLALGPAAQDPGLPIKKRVRCSAHPSHSYRTQSLFVFHRQFRRIEVEHFFLLLALHVWVSGLWWFKEDLLYVTMAFQMIRLHWSPIPPPPYLHPPYLHPHTSTFPVCVC